MDPDEVVALVVDTAEGQIDVPSVAATLKAWARLLEFGDEPS